MGNSGIYKLFWDNNKYYYYGQSGNLKIRLRKHIETLKRGLHHNRIIQRVYNKYGKPIIIIIEYCSVDNLTKREQFYIDSNISEFSCNLCPASVSSLGYKFTDEQKKNVSKSVMGRYQSDEKRKKCSQPGIFNGMYGKRHSAGTKEKMKNCHIGRQYNSGYKLSEEVKINISNGCKHKKKVININTGEIYPSIVILAKKLKVDASGLSKKLRNKNQNNTPYVLHKDYLIL